MVNVHDQAHTLARAIKESAEHKAFMAAKRRVKGNSTAEKMIADFHQKQLELQALVMQGKQPSSSQQESLQRLYGLIQGHAEVRDYLQAEQRLGVILNDIYKIISDAVDLELTLPKG